MVGSLNGLSWRDVAIVLGPTAIGIGLALLAIRTLNLLLLDDATAGGVGLAVRRARLAASGLSALLAAGAVSVAGLVAFVGLIVPERDPAAHGSRSPRSCCRCARSAARCSCCRADTLGRIAVAPLELPVGALLALIGGPYFLILLRWKLA